MQPHPTEIPPGLTPEYLEAVAKRKLLKPPAMHASEIPWWVAEQKTKEEREKLDAIALAKASHHHIEAYASAFLAKHGDVDPATHTMVVYHGRGALHVAMVPREDKCSNCGHVMRAAAEKKGGADGNASGA